MKRRRFCPNRGCKEMMTREEMGFHRDQSYWNVIIMQQRNLKERMETLGMG